MCGRYRYTSSDIRWVAKQIGVSFYEAVKIMRQLEADRWNMPPGSRTPPPIFRRPEVGAPVEQTEDIPWGIMLGNYNITCAREDNAVKHKANLTHRRCLIPMGGYYEWFRITEKKKVPHDISLPNGEPFCVAGIYGPWQGPGREGRGFAVMTCDPSPDIAWLHDRMPIVVGQEHWKDWLQDGLTFDDVTALMRGVLVPQAQALRFHAEALPLPSGRGSEMIPEKPARFPWWTPESHAVLRTIQQLMVHNGAPAEMADIESDSGVERLALQRSMSALAEHEMIRQVPAGWVVVNDTAPGCAVAEPRPPPIKGKRGPQPSSPDQGELLF